MQRKRKDRLKVEAVESAHMLILAAVSVVTMTGLDTAFGHRRDPVTAAVIVFTALLAALIVNSFLNLLLADVRERLYLATAADVEVDA